MQLRNTENHFGLIAIVFHWVMAIIMIGMIVLGLTMTQLPIGLEKLKYYGWHKEFGILILILALLRLFWRCVNQKPSLMMPWWERFAATSVHHIFYLLMFLMPLSGWMMSSAAGLPVSFFGLATLPNLLSPNEHTMHLFVQIHECLAYGLIAMIGLHTAAALKHHFIDKDNILRRMLPW